MTMIQIPPASTLMKEAMQETGLTDFGPSDWFVEPLKIQIQSINEEAQLNERGAMIQHRRLVDALANRLRLFEATRCNPEVNDYPIAVAGVLLALPRSGTTMLHRLLNAAPGTTAMKWWETRYPALLQGDELGQPIARIAAAQTLFDQLLESVPDLMSIHPMSLEHVDEEVTVLDLSFMSTSPESFLWLPSYARWLETADHTPAYDELVLWLRYLQWQDPGRERTVWLLKTPNHIAATAAALKAFPDAIFVMTHRDPIRCVPSYCSMVASLYQMSSDHIDLRSIGQHWQRRWADAMECLFSLRDNDPTIDARFLDIRYDELIAAPLAQAERVFARMGKQFTPDVKEALEAQLTTNPRDARPAHQYSLDQFGLSESGLRAAFSSYRRRIWPSN